MIGLVVTGHGHFASGMKEALNVIAGQPDNVRFVDFELNDSTEQLAEHLNAAFASLQDCDGIVTLADLTGGSPFNQAVTNGLPQGIETVAGCNLGMLLEAVSLSKNETDAKKLAENVLEAGKLSLAWFQLK